MDRKTQGILLPAVKNPPPSEERMVTWLRTRGERKHQRNKGAREQERMRMGLGDFALYDKDQRGVARRGGWCITRGINLDWTKQKKTRNFLQNQSGFLEGIQRKNHRRTEP